MCCTTLLINWKPLKCTLQKSFIKCELYLQKNCYWASQGVLVQRTCLPIQETKETQIWSLGLKDPLEEGMATHPTILAWRVPRTEDPVRLQAMGLQRVGHNWSNSKDACKAVIKEQHHQKKRFISTIILDSIYVCQYTILVFFLTYFPLCNGL